MKKYLSFHRLVDLELNEPMIQEMQPCLAIFLASLSQIAIFWIDEPESR